MQWRVQWQGRSLRVAHIVGEPRQQQKQNLTAFVRMMPYMRPQRMFGSVTFQNTSRSDAPSVRAASSCPGESGLDFQEN